MSTMSIRILNLLRLSHVKLLVAAAAGLDAAEEGPGALHHGRAAAFQHPRVALRRGGARIEVNNQGIYE